MNTFEQDIETAVRDYVLNRMNEQQEASFEEFFLSKPDVAEMVTDAQNLVLAMDAARPKSSDTDKSPSSKRERWPGGAMELLWKPVPAPIFAAYALIFAGIWFFQSSTINTSQPVALIGFTTEQMRSSEGVGFADLRNLKGDVGLMLRIPNIEHPEYKAQLFSRENGKLLWTSNSFSPNALRDALVLVPAGEINDIVRIEVQGFADNQPSELVAFCHYREGC